MSKVNMRARTLDPTKPMPIFNSADEPEILNPNTAISRAMLMMPTGMEKEEEEVCSSTPITQLRTDPCCLGAPHSGGNISAGLGVYARDPASYSHSRGIHLRPRL